MSYGVSVATVYINRLFYHIFPIRRILGAGTETPKCDCSDDSCPNVGKHPRIAWSKEAGVASMWEKWPADGFGIATGSRSGIWVLDVDPKNGGFETLAALEQKHEPLPKTVSVRTGSGGLHFYFRFPGPEYRNTAHALGPGLDTRGDGGYVVGPGSLHKSGQRYNWQNGPLDHKLMDAPEWLLKMVKQPPRVGGYTKRGEEKQGMHLASTPYSESKLLLERMLDPDCPMTKWMRDYPEEVDRESWRGFATNLACAVMDHPDLLEDARVAFHEISAEYEGYKPSETDKVFADSVTVAATYGPMSFEHMVKSGMPPDYAVPLDAKNLLHAVRLELMQERRDREKAGR
jgi:hypothetical protein